MRPFSVHPVPGLGEILPNIPLALQIGPALSSAPPEITSTDVVVVAQKAVSKAENRFVELDGVHPTPRAFELADASAKDPRLVEVILRESAEVLRVRKGVLITRHLRGFVMAHAGVDRSNVDQHGQSEKVLLLPEDPDRSANMIRDGLRAQLGVAPGIIISDSFGRPWRLGVVNIALGAAGVPSLWDHRGVADRYGRPLEVTEVGWADAVAAAAGLAMGEAAEGTPVVIVRGLCWTAPNCPAASLIRAPAEDLFR
jgi:coenzyme F420-0:L-glutamate ligase/coenzyme F420-1:gamma-L-glutamate ligase